MYGHTATIDEESQSMLIFGGYPNEEGVGYALDLNEMEWSCVNNVDY